MAKRKNMNKSIIGKLAVFIIILSAAGLGFLAYDASTKAEKEKKIAAFFESHNTVLLPASRDLQTFTLTTQLGKLFDQTHLSGQWGFLFFGFTHCPEFCPTTLMTMGKALKAIQEDSTITTTAGVPNFIMVSVDPDRDTVARLKDYIPNFSDDIIGLTGDINEITKLSKRLYAAFERVDTNEQGGAHAHHVKSAEEYMMNHSTQLYIIDPSGKFFGYVKSPLKADNIKNIFHVLATEYLF